LKKLIEFVKKVNPDTSDKGWDMNNEYQTRNIECRSEIASVASLPRNDIITAIYDIRNTKYKL